MRHFTSCKTVRYKDYCEIFGKVHAALRKKGIPFPLSKWLTYKICREKIFAGKEIIK